MKLKHVREVATEFSSISPLNCYGTQPLIGLSFEVDSVNFVQIPLARWLLRVLFMNTMVQALLESYSPYWGQTLITRSHQCLSPVVAVFPPSLTTLLSSPSLRPQEPFAWHLLDPELP